MEGVEGEGYWWIKMYHHIPRKIQCYRSLSRGTRDMKCFFTIQGVSFRFHDVNFSTDCVHVRSSRSGQAHNWAEVLIHPIQLLLMQFSGSTRYAAQAFSRLCDQIPCSRSIFEPTKKC